MNQLTVFEQGLVPVYTTDTGEHVVNGRELWEGLGSKQDFSTWVKKRFTDCEAVENEDYSSFHKKMEREIGATMRIEYIIKLDTAKEMAMLENNAIGKKVRKYFIAVEKKSKQANLDVSALSPQLQFCIQIETRQNQQQCAIETMDKRIEGIEEKMTAKNQVSVAPVQTEITLAADMHSKTMKKDRISTERVAGMYCVSARAFYETLCKLGLITAGEKRGWRLSPLYENKGIGFNEHSTSEYSTVTWSQKGVKIIKDMLKNNGVTPIKRLPPKKKVVSRKGLI
ncbi:antA/AntB antirepressor family protein [Anaerotignum sp. MB30-C6]|uniref:antA/AntB antirepressor family protein n=1 Tax=Anaerotignum sp. MB30-C6 TaxID=3070814 RepID=UPI0027DB2A87|nr:antA/AntB antirepressor family protein [Anaerotignum sp. MB30-C6]WMI81898.1 antA/AntB antirepressor family protein [Anaerotignum sp. MB30-C6]